MFARVVEATVKPERKEEAQNLVQNEIMPLVKKQTGFVDALGITEENNPHQVLSLTFWKSKEEADRFYRNNREYQQLVERVRPMLATELRIRTGNVEYSSIHRIAAGKAA